LHRQGFDACLVGGSVRDLLLGREPKDFDVATDATPNEVRRLFRNSRIIGRRFRLVHVFFHDGTVEVSTFRAQPENDESGSDPMVTDDNVFGDPRADAFRRDLTVNGLFYDIGDYSIVDYVGGVEDLEEGNIRVIGDPDVRFREDPVRMLRACEMAGRLGFVIDEQACDAIRRHCGDLEKASPARLVEEVIELLRCGAAHESIEWMIELGLAEVLLPEVNYLDEAEQAGFGEFGELFPALDRLTGRREVHDSLLLAVLFVAPVVVRRQRLEQRLGRPLRRREVAALIDEVIAECAQRLNLSNARSRRAAITLELFQRLCEPPPLDWRVRRVSEHDLFHDAVLLFELLVEATGEGQEMLEEWLQAARDSDEAPPPRRRRRRRRTRRRHRRH
jgi:poly(A) polymerase